MTKNPFFSVITCTRNSVGFVSKNVTSVKSQEFKDYEHIFIDGLSTDGTLKFIKKYRLQNPKRVKLFLYPPLGVSTAFNKAIKKSSGEWIIFLNSDDSFYDKNVLKDVHNYLEKNSKIDWLYGKINVLYENDVMGKFPNKRIFETSDSNLLKFVNFIPHQAVFMKKEVFTKFGLFDEKLYSSMDYDLYLRIAKKTRWTFYNRIISNYLIHAGSVSSSLSTRAKNLENLRKVQQRYLNLIELPVAVFTNSFINHINKIYAKQKI
jgi:glycosyltransferase involved in cell wall biosynthesis